MIQFSDSYSFKGMDCCSNTTISFHYVTPIQQYFIDKMRYGFRDEN